MIFKTKNFKKSELVVKPLTFDDPDESFPFVNCQTNNIVITSKARVIPSRANFSQKIFLSCRLAVPGGLNKTKLDFFSLSFLSPSSVFSTNISFSECTGQKLYGLWIKKSENFKSIFVFKTVAP